MSESKNVFIVSSLNAGVAVKTCT